MFAIEWVKQHLRLARSAWPAGEPRPLAGSDKPPETPTTGFDRTARQCELMRRAARSPKPAPPPANPTRDRR